MTINENGLKYSKNRKYEILISTYYLDEEYFVKIRFEIMNYNYVPIISIRYFK